MPYIITVRIWVAAATAAALGSIAGNDIQLTTESTNAIPAYRIDVVKEIDDGLQRLGAVFRQFDSRGAAAAVFYQRRRTRGFKPYEGFHVSSPLMGRWLDWDKKRLIGVSALPRRRARPRDIVSRGYFRNWHKPR